MVACLAGSLSAMVESVRAQPVPCLEPERPFMLHMLPSQTALSNREWHPAPRLDLLYTCVTSQRS